MVDFYVVLNFIWDFTVNNNSHASVEIITNWYINKGILFKLLANTMFFKHNGCYG